MGESKSRKELTFEEAEAYTKHRDDGGVCGRLRRVLLELLEEKKIKAYWSDDSNGVVYRSNRKKEVM